MQRYFLEVAYNGTAFHGSQIQGNTPTVQLAINTALSTLLRQPIISFGASRTDEGVHALSNVYHFDIDQQLHPHFHYKLNAVLPHTISVNAIYQAVDPELNARFDAISRSYRYRLYASKNPFYYQRGLYYPYTFNVDALHLTAAIIREYQDFESFSKRSAQTNTFLCTIHDCRWEHQGDQLHFVVRANRFLRGMVRALVGTQPQVARGNYTPEVFRSIIEGRDCTKADFSVPGYGLYLEKIEYPEGALLPLHLM